MHGMNEFSKLEILLENSRLMAIHKPSGLLVIPDRWEKSHVTLMSLGKKYLGKNCWPIHRLDREASGVLLMAKDADMRTYLGRQFQKRQVQKMYHALVQGVVDEEKGEIHHPIGEDLSRPGRMKIGGKGAKEAHTYFEILERFKTVSMVLVRIITGRQHQIRVHMKSIGHPVICDPIYGSGKPYLLSEMKKFYKFKEDEPEKPLMGRLGLHASSLEFYLGEGELCRVEAPLPKDFEVFLKYLRRYSK